MNVVLSLPRTSSACPARWRSGASTACIEAIAPCSRRRAPRAGADGGHVRPAPSDRTREPGRPADDPRAQARADRGRRCRDGARGAVHVGAAAADSGGVRSGYLRAIGTEVVLAGEDFRFGVRRCGDLGLLERLGFQVVVPPRVDGVSSTAIRAAVADGDVVGAAAMLGRPFELDGTVVAGDQRGGTLGYPTANLLLEPDLACPRYGIYAGAARGHRAAVSIGTNPHYGGTERRIEPYLLDFEGDLYGRASCRGGLGATAGRGGLRVGGRARRPDRPGRRGDARRAPAVA